MKQLVVNKEDLKHNINRIKDYTKKISNDDNYTIIAVVKGNGYGLGLNEYSEVLVENGIKYLAVATFEEAIELRKKQKDVNILMMSPLYNKQELEETVKNNITIAIDSKENAEAVNELAHKGYNIKVHLKIDTGFGRYGFIYDDYENILNTVQSLKPNVEIEGIFTHCSDAYRKNNKHTLEQFKRFTDVIEKLEANNIKIKLKHICNSPAILNYPEMHLTAARIGSAFVGRVCSENNIGLKKIGELDFVLQKGLHTELVEIKSGNDFKKHLAMDHAMKVEQWKFEKNIVFSKSNVEEDGEILYLPWYMILFYKQEREPEKMIYEIDLSGLV